MSFAEDLSIFFDDFAVVATWTPTGQSQRAAYVLFDSPDETVLGDAVMTTEYAIEMRASDFTGLKYGETVTVSGVIYTVREVRLLDDGALKRATLSRA